MVAHRSAAAAAFGIGLALAAAPASATLLAYQADLIPANPAVNSQISGKATFILNTAANTLAVTVNASGFDPNTIHPQHIHGLFENAGCENVAPAGSPIAGLCLDGTIAKDSHLASVATNDIDKDGFLEVIEATPATGPEIMQLADPALGLAGLPNSFPKSDAAGNLSFSATYDLNTTDLLFDVDNNIKHEPGDLLPLDKRVYEIHGLFVNNDNPPVPGDLPEILGPTHAYVMELPAAAGELRLVSVPEPGIFGLLATALAGFAGLRRRRPKAL